MGNDPSDNKHDQKLQAVLLADSFMTTFRPITLDKTTPKVLCPLNNVTMLDYSIEFLAGAGVEELYVFCVTGGDTVESYLETSTSSWASSIKVKCVKDSSVTNAGDALRELDKRNLIQSDPFVLMSGDVVTNVDIGSLLKEHELRHKKDSSAIMTVLLNRVGGWSVGSGSSENRNGSVTAPSVDFDASRHNLSAGVDGGGSGSGSAGNAGTLSQTSTSNAKYAASPLRSLTEDLVVALNPKDPAGNRILLYDSNPYNSSVSLPTSFFDSNSQIDVRNDVLDTGIYICSPEVLARFSDEFDYLYMSKFISNSVAEEEEGLQNKIYASILKENEYAARIHDPRTYHAVSRDLLRRWCYPVVPDNLPSGYEKVYRYEMQRRMVYREMRQGGTKVGRSTVMTGPGMVGSNCTIGERCHIKGTVIGNYCTIDDNSNVQNSQLWSNVTIAKNATVVESILCNDCVIKQNAVIPKGCIIGKGCVIGENVVLEEFTRITLCKEFEEDDDFDHFDDDDDDDDDDSEEFETLNTEDLDGEEDDNDSQESKGHSVKGVEFTTAFSDHDVVGKDGLGRVWVPPVGSDEADDFDDDDDDSSVDSEVMEKNRALARIKSQSIGYDATELFSKRKMAQEEEEDFLSEDEYDEYKEDMDEEGFNTFGSAGAGNMSSTNLNEDGLLITGRQRGIDVVKELKLICLEHEVSNPVENLAIELNSFKFSQNATFGDCATGAILAVLERIEMTSNMSAAKLISDFKGELVHWGALFKRLCHSIEEEKIVLMAVESAAVGGGVIGEVLSREPAFRFILQTMHDEDIVTEEAILSWAAKRRAGDDNVDADSPRGKLFFQKHTQDFLEWLAEESDDDSDDDSSSGSDDDSSD